MKVTVHPAVENVQERLSKRNVSRRDFLRYCGLVAAAMGMGPAFAVEVAQALTAPRRPSVVYLHNAECTGCSEALLRTGAPYIDELILDTLSLDYHETIMAAAGEAAEEALKQAINAKEGFIAVVEGAVPTGDAGQYGYIGGRTMLEIGKEILPRANAVIAYGTCAAYGGIQAAAPNPTGARGVNEAFAEYGVKAINVPGCPPNPINLVGTIVALLKGTGLKLDRDGRPLMFYGKTVHELCERRKHFEAGEFAPSFKSEEARKGWCLYELGCKGPVTMNNCPKARFNDTNWPVGAGHPCIGCSEPGFWDNMGPFYEN